MSRLVAALLLVACGSSSPAPAGPGGDASAEVVVITDGAVALAPALAALSETLPSGSAVAVVRGGALVVPMTPIASLAIAEPPRRDGALAASVERALGVLGPSKAAVRAVIVASDRSSPTSGALAGAITGLRRAGVLGYAIRVGPALPDGALAALGYTMSRRIESADRIAGIAGAIGSAIGSR